MWKRLDPRISTSEKHSKLGFSSLTLWVMMLPHTDSKGRYWANASYIKGQCLPLFDHVRLEQVEAALLELEKTRLIHLFDSEGKRYLVYHDVEDFNPPGALRYTKPQWPAPPEGVCRCLDSRRVHAVNTLLVSSPSSSSSRLGGGGVEEGEDWPPMKATPRGLLWGLFRKAKITGTPSQLRQYFEAWYAQAGAQRLEEILMDPKVKGVDVFAVQRWFFNDILANSRRNGA